MTALSVHSGMLGMNVLNMSKEPEDDARVCREKEREKKKGNGGGMKMFTKATSAKKPQQTAAAADADRESQSRISSFLTHWAENK